MPRKRTLNNDKISDATLHSKKRKTSIASSSNPSVESSTILKSGSGSSKRSKQVTREETSSTIVSNGSPIGSRRSLRSSISSNSIPDDPMIGGSSTAVASSRSSQSSKLVSQLADTQIEEASPFTSTIVSNGTPIRSRRNSRSSTSSNLVSQSVNNHEEEKLSSVGISNRDSTGSRRNARSSNPSNLVNHAEEMSLPPLESRRNSRSSNHSTLNSQSLDHQKEVTSSSTTVSNGTIEQTEKRSRTPNSNLASSARSRRPRAGSIKSIKLLNFMCHKSLSIEFNSNINFVIGENGSGKSAILAGLLICLGSKAHFTNRANSVQHLIKEGETSACVRVELNNKGTGCYKSHEYGPVIILERHLSRNGGSSYKIKSSIGKVVSRAKTTIDTICNFLGIQINNPLAFLTQETAKQFLGSSSPAKKYELFMNGILLQQSSELYKATELQLEICAEEVKAHETQNLVVLKEEVDKREAQLVSRINLEKSKNELDELKQQKSWIKYYDQERINSTFEKQIERIEKQQVSIRSEIAEAEGNINREALEIEQKSMDVKHAATTELKDKQSALEETNNQIKETELVLHQISREKSDLNKMIDDLNKKKTELEQKLQETQENQNSDNKKSLNEKRDKLKAELNDITASMRESDANIKNLSDTLETGYGKELDSKNSITRISNEINILKNQIERLENHNRNRFLRYGDAIPAVMKEIQNSKFQSKPIGPLGLYIESLAPEWNGILEAVMYQTLTSFLVDNHSDSYLLSSILKKHKCNNTINIMPREEFQFEHYQPDSMYNTVNRILKFSDKYVQRFFVAKHSIESTILIKDRAEADKIMRSQPTNVTRCYALDATGRYGFSVGGINGGSSTKPIQPNRNKLPILSHSERQDLEWKKQLSIRQQDLLKEQCISQDIGSQIGTLKLKMHEEKSRLSQLRTRSYDLQKEIRQCEDLILSFTDMTIDLQKASIEEIDKTVKLYKNQLLESEINENEKFLEKSRLEGFRRNQDKDLTAIKKGIAAKSKEIEDLELSRQSLSSKVKSKKLKLQNNADELDKLRTDLEKAEEKLKDLFASAEKECPQVEVNYTGSELEHKIEIIASKIREAEQHSENISIEELTKKVEEAKTKLETNIQASAEIKEAMEISRRSLEVRKRGWTNKVTKLTQQATKLFAQNLENRGFCGDLIIDHVKKVLEVNAYPSSARSVNHDNSSSNTTHGLSGGERSYTTVCLLLAVWGVMNSPIRCLDEFDVFMDAVNRNFSLAKIIKFARKSPNIQHIFISPQGLSSLQHANDINVIKLDPARS